jgi:hypothetical protein
MGRLRLLLELEPDSDPIRGSLEDQRGQRATFYGWMEFAAAVSALHEARTAEVTPRAAPPRGRADETGDGRR